MIKLIFAIIIAVIGVAMIVAAIRQPKSNSSTTEHHSSSPIKKAVPQILKVVGGILILIALVLGILSTIVLVEPGQIGLAYCLDGSRKTLHQGYNGVAPWNKQYQWETKTQVITYSEGEGKDDIYGAQTNERDYIQIVSTISVCIDTERLDEYIAMYGNEQVNSPRIRQQLKTLSRNAVESVVGVEATAYVMSNKNLISEKAEEKFEDLVAYLPLVIESFTIDDLVAPDNYEEAIKTQAQLRMERETAKLQQDVNQEKAEADKIKAEGEAAVARVQAEKDADIKRIAANNEAEVKVIAANNEAEVKVIKANNDAEVRRTQAETEAKVKETEAAAEAKAITTIGQAEAEATAAKAAAYSNNPQYMELKLREVQAEVEKAWAEHWSGISFGGMSSINYANLTGILSDLLSGLIPETS